MILQHLNQTLTFVYIENVVKTSFICLFYCVCLKFNLTGGFLIFLFMVTSRGIIFICSADVVYDFSGKIFLLLLY